MHRIATALTLASAIAFAPMVTPVAHAQAKAKNASSLEIPITGIGGTLANPTGQKFAGTFTLQRFVNDNGKLLAVGTVSGTVTDSLGNVLTTGLQTVALPVVASQEGAAATAVPGITAAATCPILNLVLGPLDLNLLGLAIHLNQVVLNITAIPGAGNLLGNLLCAVAGLLDNPGGLAALLNQILAILAGL